MSRPIASTTRVAFVAEVTQGTTPASPAFTILRATGENLEVRRKLVFSSELNARRGEKNHALASKGGGGSIPFEFTDATLETLLESALRAAWNTDELIDANTPKFFTFEVTYEAGGTDIYKRIKGAEVSSLAMQIRAGEIVTGSVDILGMDGEFFNAAIGSSTYGAGNVEPIMVGAHFGTLAMSGLTIDQLISVDFMIQNNMREQLSLGSLTPTGLGAGKLEVTGSLSAYLDSTRYDMLQAYQAGTATSLSFVLGTTTLKKTSFDFPTIVLSDVKVAAETAEGDVLINANWRALQDTDISGGVVEINRNIA